MDRIMGVLTLKAPVYQQIANDQNATRTAAIIVAIVSVIIGLIGPVVFSGISAQVPAGLAGVASSNPILDALLVIILGIAGWGIGSWIMGFVANLFGGKTNTGEMLRVFGYASIFNVLGIIPCIGLIIGTILGIAAAVMGIREAASVSTGKAIAIGIVGFIPIVVVCVIIAIVLGFILAPLGVGG